jgi:hypothetical protein
MTAKKLMATAPVDWEKAVDKILTRQRDELRRQLEGIAERAAVLAGYMDERHGYGCGDQGHKKAVKQANRNGKMVWMKVFGYNGYVEVHP